jgi:hypothetical protein
MSGISDIRLEGYTGLHCNSILGICSFAFGDWHSFVSMQFENKVLRKIIGPQRHEVNRELQEAT